MIETLDYSKLGMTVQQAMVDHAKRNPNKSSRPKFLKWGMHQIRTSDAFDVPHEGTIRLAFLSPQRKVRQGVDISLNGYLELAAGEQVSVLRTWQDERFEDVVEYPFYSKDGLLRTWNVYEMQYPNGQSIEEKWTENAGLWIEVVSGLERVYHCSHGMDSPPRFDTLVFKLTISERTRK